VLTRTVRSRNRAGLVCYGPKRGRKGLGRAGMSTNLLAGARGGDRRQPRIGRASPNCCATSGPGWWSTGAPRCSAGDGRGESPPPRQSCRSRRAADDEADCAALVEEYDTFGRLDILINCAGIAERPAPPSWTSPRRIRRPDKRPRRYGFHTCRVAARVMASQGQVDHQHRFVAFLATTVAPATRRAKAP